MSAVFSKQAYRARRGSAPACSLWNNSSLPGNRAKLQLGYNLKCLAKKIPRYLPGLFSTLLRPSCKRYKANAVACLPGKWLALLLAPGISLAVIAGIPASARGGTLASVQEAMQKPISASDISHVGVILALILLLAVLIALGRHYLGRKKKITPLGWIDSPKQIYQILDSAVRYRSTFELQFPHRGARRRPVLRCAPEDISSEGLMVEAEGIKNIAHRWTNRQVNCYFKINVKGQNIFYAFTSTIKKVQTKPFSRCSLTLGLPERLENRQKRAFLRIVPPQEYLLGAAMWLGHAMPKPEDFPHMNRWPKAPLVSLPEKNNRQFEIADMSAGGLRLTISRKAMVKAGLELGVAEQVLLILDLLNPDDRSLMRLWLHCRVQNFAAQYDTHNVEVGLQFLGWAAPKAGNPVLEWFKLNRSPEIDRLGNWIIRRHLELFREAPEADDDYPF